MSFGTKLWLGLSLVGAALCAPGCRSGDAPCEDFDFSRLEVDTSSGAPVFSWSGGLVEFLDVYPGQLPEEPEASGGPQVPPGTRPLWEPACQCQTEDADICENERSCLSSPVTYGEVPPTPVQVSEDRGVQELVSGETYTVVIGSFCTSSDIGQRSIWTSFQAP